MEEAEEQRLENNALIFQLAISNIFKQISEAVSKDEFCEKLTILKSNPSVAPKLHQAMIKELYESLNKDLEEILNDEVFRIGLSKVYELTESTTIPEYETAWRPPGNVLLHQRSLDAEVILQETAELEKQVNEIEKENELLMKEVSERRTRISNMQDNVIRALNHYPVACERLGRRIEQLREVLNMLQED